MDEKTLAQVSEIVNNAVEVIGESIVDSFSSNDGESNIYDAFKGMSDGIGLGLERMGVNGADGGMGAIEALADEVHKGSEAIAESIGDLALAIRERNEIEEKKLVAQG